MPFANFEIAYGSISGLVFLAWAAISIYNFMEGEALISDFIRGYKLRKCELKDLDYAASQSQKPKKTVVSLTSIPSRLPVISETLKSLLDQTSPPGKIYLNLPEYSVREKCLYSIPEFLKNLDTIEIIQCDDYGPATKFIPSIQRMPEDQLIIVVDDDRIYPPNLIADIEAAAEVKPDTVFCFSGWIVPDDLIDRSTTILSNVFMRPPAPVRATRISKPHPIDILQGVSGYGIRKRFFKDIDALADYSDAPKAAFFVDDVWVSAHCDAPKEVVPANRSNYQRPKLSEFYVSNSLGLINRGDGNPEKRNNSIMIQYFQDRWRVGGKKQ